jgi:hypothetical protein
MMLESAPKTEAADSGSWRDQIISCLTPILSTFKLIVTTESLSQSGSSETSALFSQVLGQLANGEPKGRKMTQLQTQPNSTVAAHQQLKLLSKLFALVDEIACFPNLTDLGFVMQAVTTMQGIVGCADRLAK